MPEIAHAPRSKFKWLLMALALAAAMFLVVLSACGGDDDEGDDTGDKTPAATKTAGADHEATETPANNEDGDGGNDATAALSKFASDYERFTGMVKYEIKDFSGTDAGSLSSMAIYQSADSSRVDIESSDGNIIIIDTPDASYMCTENQCLKSPAGDSSGSAATAFTEMLDPKTIQDEFGSLPSGVDVKTSKEKIAGINATCFSAKGDFDATTPGDEEGEVCFAEGGLMLRIIFSGGGSSGTFEATEASTKVSDSDFEPPYEVVDLSQLGQ